MFLSVLNVQHPEKPPECYLQYVLHREENSHFSSPGEKRTDRKESQKLFNGYFKKKKVTVQKSVWSYVEGLCHCVTPLHYHFNGHESRGWEETLHTKIMTFVLGGPPQYFRKLCSCFKAVFSFYLKHLVSCFRQ